MMKSAQAMVASLTAAVLAASVLAQDAPPAGKTQRVKSQPRLSHIKVNGIRLRVAQQGDGPAVLLLHGFPETWYNWRHQMAALAEAGYRAIAPDLRGFGESDAPQQLEDYDILDIVGDVNGLLNALNVEKVTVVGHDWGGIVAWCYALLEPKRVRALVSVGCPWEQRWPTPPIATLRQAIGENFSYMVYYQKPGVAEAELDPNVRAVFQRVMVSPDTPTEPPKITDPKASAGGLLDRLPVPKERPPWLTKEHLDHLVTTYQRTGFRGGLNYYRNIDRSWELTPQLAEARVQVPVLFIGGAQDPVLQGRDVTSTKDPMRTLAPKLTAVHLLPNTGHWVQLERPAKVNSLLIAFLKSHTGKP